LQKLFDACISIIAASTSSWRLVIGRFGRLGHGELKGWNALLGKKSLLNACAQLRESCPTCFSVMNHAGREVDHPSILSACLVSLVADTSLTGMPVFHG
jgi:mediator of RNA polymerase II transcription subunit 13